VDIKKNRVFFNSKLAVLNYRENYFLYIQKLKHFKIVLEIEFFFNSKLAVLNYRENYFLYIQKLKNFKIVLEIARKLNNG
jgi:hypothetical protein